MPKFFESVGNFLFGSPEKYDQVSTLTKNQQPLADQAINAGLRSGAGGAFGQAADYYRNNLSNNPEDFEAFARPEQRQFHEQIIPGLSEQFAGMGAGGLSSSGFRNAAIGAGVDLQERLGQLRAQLRQNSAQGLQNIGQVGLQPFSQNQMVQQGSPGFLSSVASGLGQLGASAIGDWAGQKFGKTSPYGQQGPNASPQG